MTREGTVPLETTELEQAKDAAKQPPADAADSSVLSDVAGISDVIDGVGIVVSAVFDVMSIFE